MVTVAYVDSDGIERTYAIGHEPVLVGRSPECGIRSNDPLVSRKHARLYLDAADNLFIEDLGSANGVFVGPNRVERAAIPIGAVAVAGSLRFRRLAVAPTGPSQEVPIEPHAALRSTQAVVVPQSVITTPAPVAMPPADARAMLVHLLEVERKARLTVEEERDAYGARMAELHRQLADAQARIAELSQTIAELERLVRGRNGG